MHSAWCRIWRAAHGSKPSEQHLAPKDAQTVLARLLAREREGARPAARTAFIGRTTGDAIAAYLHRAETDKRLSPHDAP